jgi:histone-lysine N-methyltransferase SETMAR
MSHGYFNTVQRRNVKVITKAQMFRLKKFKIKTMLITLFNTQVVIHKEFVPEGRTVNSAFFVEVIGRLLKRISRVRPQFRAEGSWFLLYDNAPSHSAPVVKTFLVKHGVVEINHPSYSPDLAPADFFLFPTVGTALKERGFRMLKILRKT